MDTDFLIPAVIFFGADETVEMDQFHTVNSNAKKISTDLHLMTCSRTSVQNDDAYRKYLDEVGEGWKVVFQDLTEKSLKTEGVEGEDRFPNDPKGTHNSSTPTRSFFAKIRVIDQENFAKYLPEDRAKSSTPTGMG